MMRKPYKTPSHGPTARTPLTESPLRRYFVGVLSASKAGKRVHLETIWTEVKP